MGREEAIKWLGQIPDRYIHGGDEAYDEKRKEAIDMAISALRAQADTPPNNPLTMEELREMEKEPEPIYITGLGWKICHGIEDFFGR